MRARTLSTACLLLLFLGFDLALGFSVPGSDKESEPADEADDGNAEAGKNYEDGLLPNSQDYGEFARAGHELPGDDAESDAKVKMVGELAKTGAEATGVNVVTNNVVVISWLQAGESYDPKKKYQTVGALIATNAIVCAPSFKVPVNIHNTSNWNVHQVQFAKPSRFVEGNKVVVVYHPDFTMDKDAANRIALIMLLPDVEEYASAMIPIKMVAAPFLPMVETTRHDDYSLSSCVMVVPSEHGDGVAHVEMSAVMCRHNKHAKKAFQDRVCAYTKMTEKTLEVMARPTVSPRDMGNPLICGNLLVGVYAGVQNIRGTYHKEKGPDGDKNIPVGGKRLSNDEQYVFDIPGAPKNFEFLSAFVNEEQRKMRWEQKLNLKDTNECLIEESRHDIASGPTDDSRMGETQPAPEGDDSNEAHAAEGEEGEAAAKDSGEAELSKASPP